MTALISRAMQQRDDEGVRHGRTGGQRLAAEQAEAAAVQDALVARRRTALIGDDADHERADEPADEVDADDVERVVVAQAVLEA